jgi:hypothetical protein
MYAISSSKHATDSGLPCGRPLHTLVVPTPYGPLMLGPAPIASGLMPQDKSSADVK